MIILPPPRISNAGGFLVFRDARAHDPGIDDRRIADALVASTAVGRLIFPSDRGRQTASGDVRKQRVTFGMKGSMN